jgi:hypothetical protein
LRNNLLYQRDEERSAAIRNAAIFECRARQETGATI